MFNDTAKWREETLRDIERREREARTEYERLSHQADEHCCEHYGLIICPECEGRYTFDYPADGQYRCQRCNGKRFLWPDGRTLTHREAANVIFGDDLPETIPGLETGGSP